MFTFYLRYPANRSPGLCARGGFRVLLVVLMDSVANDGDPGNGSGDDCKPLRGRARLPVANDLPAHGFTNNRGLLRPYRCRSLPQRKTKSFPYCLQTIVVLPGCAGLLGWRCRTGRRGLSVCFTAARLSAVRHAIWHGRAALDALWFWVHALSLPLPVAFAGGFLARRFAKTPRAHAAP